MRQSRNQLSAIVREVGINGFRYPNEIERYFKEYENEYLDRIYKEDLERIDRIQKILTSL
jgi:predicted nucleotidyltransferase